MSGERAKAVAAAIQAGADQNEETEGGIVVSFVAVAEMMSPDGQKWMITIAADGQGDFENVTGWQIRGLLHEALYPADGDSG